MLLSAIAHNVLVWARSWLKPAMPRLASYGALRLTRDVFGVSGFIESDEDGTIISVVLNKGAPLAFSLAEAFGSLLKSQKIALSAEKI